MKSILFRRLSFIVIFVSVIAAVASVLAFALVPQVYTASGTVYVLGIQSEDANSQEAVRLLAGDCSVLINSRTAAQAAVPADLNPSDFRIDAAPAGSSRFISITVTGQDRADTLRLAVSLFDYFTDSAPSLMAVEGVTVLDAPQVSSLPTNNREPLILICVLAALILSIPLSLLLRPGSAVRAAKRAAAVRDSDRASDINPQAFPTEKPHAKKAVSDKTPENAKPDTKTSDLSADDVKPADKKPDAKKAVSPDDARPANKKPAIKKAVVPAGKKSESLETDAEKTAVRRGSGRYNTPSPAMDSAPTAAPLSEQAVKETEPTE